MKKQTLLIFIFVLTGLSSLSFSRVQEQKQTSPKYFHPGKYCANKFEQIKENILAAYNGVKFVNVKSAFGRTILEEKITTHRNQLAVINGEHVMYLEIEFVFNKNCEIQSSLIEAERIEQDEIEDYLNS